MIITKFNEHPSSHIDTKSKNKRKSCYRNFRIYLLTILYLMYNSVGYGLPGVSDGKESAHNAGDQGSISGLGRSPGKGNGSPLQYCCLENIMSEEPGRLQSSGS